MIDRSMPELTKQAFRIRAFAGMKCAWYQHPLQMNCAAANYGVSEVFRHAGLDPASSLSFSGFRPANDVSSRSPE